MLEMVEHIYRLDKKISEIWEELPGKSKERHFVSALIEEIMWSNGIEGVHSSKQELRKAFDAATERTNRKEKFRGLLEGYMRMLQHDKILVQFSVDIRNIYDTAILPDLDAVDAPDGDIFRKGGVSIVTATEKEKHHGILPESELIKFIDSALGYLENNNHSLVSIAVFHYLFGYAHPFYDGNGRISRFLSSLFLSKNLNLLIGWNMSQTISENKKSYYDSFDICNDKRSMGDITPFVLYYLSVVEGSALGILKSLDEAKAKLDYYDEVLETISAGSLSDLSIEILQSLLEVTLFSDKGISLGGISRYVEVGVATIRACMQNMIIKGYPVVMQRDGKMKLYRLDIPKLDSLAAQET